MIAPFFLSSLVPHGNLPFAQKMQVERRNPLERTLSGLLSPQFKRRRLLLFIGLYVFALGAMSLCVSYVVHQYQTCQDCKRDSEQQRSLEVEQDTVWYRRDPAAETEEQEVPEVPEVPSPQTQNPILQSHFLPHPTCYCRTLFIDLVSTSVLYALIFVVLTCTISLMIYDYMKGGVFHHIERMRDGLLLLSWWMVGTVLFHTLFLLIEAPVSEEDEPWFHSTPLSVVSSALLVSFMYFCVMRPCRASQEPEEVDPEQLALT